MRKIKRIFVHCTAGSQRQSIEDLKAEFTSNWSATACRATTPPPSMWLTWVASLARASLSTTARLTRRTLLFCYFTN